MAVQTPLYVIQNASHPAKTFRQANGYYVNTEGVGTTGDLAVTANSTPAMNVDVAAGEVWIKGDSATDQGFYFGYNDATVNLAIASADGSNPRIDIVVAQVNDAAYSGSANNWELKVITGTAAGSPSVPTLPSSAYKLAQIAVGAGVTTIVSGNITDSRTTVEVATYGVHHFEQTTAPGTTTNKLYNVGGALHWNGADISTAGDITGVTAGTNLNGGGASGAVTLNLDTTLTGGLTFSGALQINNTVTVGVEDTGHDVKFWGADPGEYMLWDESAANLQIVGATGGASADIVLSGDGSGYTDASVQLKADNDARGTGVYGFNAYNDTTWYWGNPYNYEDSWRICRKASTTSLDVSASDGGTYKIFTVQSNGDCVVSGALSKASGSFDIAHPTKGGDWRLRHSFIEGPQADNIYRGTATISGSSVTVDLDTVSNMTNGTWEALNTNPWTMVSSSGNAVEWSLSGKTLTITGPDKAVCNWMVIGERHDEHMKAQSTIADDDGKLIVEYEQPEEVSEPPGS